MNTPTEHAEDKRAESNNAGKPRRARVAALLNAVPTLCALVLVAAHLSGPKLPPTCGD